jgi:RNA polymerase sigma-70 factor (ECF subfamily)
LLRRLVDEHLDFVWRSLRRLGLSASDAEDAAQEVFLVVSRRLEDIRLGSEKSFLAGTAVRVAQTHRRTVARRREWADDSIAELLDAGATPEDELRRRRQHRELDAILAQLGPELRTVLVLHDIEELNSVEISALLGIPVGTVASRLRRARQAFQLAVKRRTAHMDTLEDAR